MTIFVISVDTCGSVKVLSSSFCSAIFLGTRASLSLAAADFKVQCSVDYVQAGICMLLDLSLWAETVHFFLQMHIITSVCLQLSHV